MKNRGYWTRLTVLTLWTELIFRRVSKLTKASIKLR